MPESSHFLEETVKVSNSLVGMTLLPAIVSIAISIWPVHGKYMMNLPEEFHSFQMRRRSNFIHTSQEDEKTELESARHFILTDERRELKWRSPKMWLLRGKEHCGAGCCEGTQQERVATFTVWESQVGFKAARWILDCRRYDMGDDIKGLPQSFSPMKRWNVV